MREHGYLCDGTGSYKTCKKCYWRKHYQENKEYYKALSAARYKKDKETLNKNSRIYYQNNRDRIKALSKKNYEDNSQSYKLLSKIYYQKNRERIREVQSIYYRKKKNKNPKIIFEKEVKNK